MAVLEVQYEKDLLGNPPTFTPAALSGGDTYRNVFPEPEVWLDVSGPTTVTFTNYTDCNYGGHPNEPIIVAPGILKISARDQRRYTDFNGMAQITCGNPSLVQIAILVPMGTQI